MRDYYQEKKIKKEFPDYPCVDCSRDCKQSGCMTWREWFLKKWREIRLAAKYMKESSNVQDQKNAD